jgi:threonine/homoserine/homoserine lactone efflux protein
MPDSQTLLLFITAALLLLLTPGPAVFYIVARSLDQGRLAGLVSTLGINTGTLFHIAAAAFGLSALLMSSALAFGIVKYLGAAYLVYLGIRTLLERAEETAQEVRQVKALRRVYYEAVLVNLLNPKTALFFFAFLPQFIDPGRGAVSTQVVFLGGVLVLLGILSDGAYALLAGTAGRWLRGNPRFARLQRRFAGTIYLALGVGTVFINRR